MRLSRWAGIFNQPRTSNSETVPIQPDTGRFQGSGGNMEASTDVFVIGGGPAGLAAAIAAREKGFQVIVADGGRPPIDKACGEGLLPDALAAIRRLGVVMEKSDGYAFRGIRFHDGTTSVEADFPNGNGVGVRRKVLHQKMVERAQDCGVSFLWNAPVTGITAKGVLVGGAEVPARWIVGADGSRSRLRRWSRLEAHTQLDQRYAYRRHYRLEPWTDCMEIYWGKDTQAYVTPVSEQEVCIALVSRRSSDRLDETLREFPRLHSRIKSAEPASTERGAITAMHRLRRVCRGNVALIGDASGSVDAITGEGLCLSFRQATVLADALEAGELSRYEMAHRRLFKRPTVMGNLMLLLDRRPRLRERALRGMEASPDVFARMVAIHVGATSRRHMAATGALLGWRFLTA